MQIARDLGRHGRGTTFERFSLTSADQLATRANREVRIHYFTDHPSTVLFWKTPEGQRCVTAVADWLRQHAGPDLMWSANKDVAPVMAAKVHGEQVSPLLAGLNLHRHRTWAALVYSAKMQPHEREALRIFEPDPERVRASREIEALIQFVFRTALRASASTATINFVVYDRYQAEAVADYLQRNGLALTEVIGHDIGIGDIVPSKVLPSPARRGRPPSGKPAMTALQRQRNRRKRQRLLQAGRKPTP